MKILFMGTPDFAAQSLKMLIENEYNVVGVVSQPDKPKGRGHKTVPTDVKIVAMEYNIPVYQPEKLKNGELLPILDELKPDIICVVAYGKILPEYILNYPKYGCINVHGSLLPKYRGSAPIQWAVLNGDEETGITTMKMDKGLDTGDILLVEKTKINENETSHQLFDRLAVIGGNLLIKTIDGLFNGTITPIPQNHDEHTTAPMIKKEMAKIDWTKGTKEILNKIRGMNSWPMAYTLYKGNTVKIISAAKAEGEPSKAGEIISLDKNKGLKVSCQDGCIYLCDVQFPGSKRMNIEDYMRGHEIEIGYVFGI